MTPGTATPRRLGTVELIALLSMVMALGALGVDLILPAFAELRSDLGLAPDSNQVAGVVTSYVLGLAIGTLFFGPLADRFGRRPMLFVGYAIYALGAVASALAPGLELLVVSRAVWGFGAAASRTIALSVIRDLYEGDQMARIMSFVFAVFIVIPIIAPTIGAAIVAVAPWRWIFWFPAVFAAAVALWNSRLGETLDPQFRLDLRPADLLRAAKVVMSSRQTTGHMLALTASFGSFVSWLATSELIVSDVFDRASQFPLIFGGLAAVMGVAMLTNARLVRRIGVVRLVRTTVAVYVGAAAILVIVARTTDGTPPLWAFLVSMAAIVGMHALLIPNTNSRAMDPMGEVAGTAAAIIGAVFTAGGAIFGAVIDRFYDGTITPLATGFLVSSVLALVMVNWAESAVP